jgi:PAS domain S-box-containing protein
LISTGQSHKGELPGSSAKEGRFIFVNETARKVFGLSPKECVGRSAIDFVHPDDKERTRNGFSQWIKEKRASVTFENRQVSESGEIREMLWAINFSYDDKGNVTSIKSIARDIADRKKAEARIKSLNKLEESLLGVGTLQEKAKRITDGLIECLDADFAFKVRMNPGQARQVERLDSVAWAGLFQPAYKLSPGLATRSETNLYRVRIERGADARSAAEAIAATGVQVLDREGNVLLVSAEAAQLDDIAQVLDVAWVQHFKLREKHNEYGGGGIMGAGTAEANGYDGSTQIVAVADTGIGGGTAATAHADVPSSRVTAIYDWAASDAANCYYAYPDGAQDVDSGHGTHTALSVLGDGGASGEGQGAAPAASLVFQSVEDYADMYGSCFGYADGYYLLGLPDDLTDLFQQAYDAGARIHSNSWGSSDAGDYTDDSVTVDTFMWNNPDMGFRSK